MVDLILLVHSRPSNVSVAILNDNSTSPIDWSLGTEAVSYCLGPWLAIIILASEEIGAEEVLASEFLQFFPSALCCVDFSLTLRRVKPCD